MTSHTIIYPARCTMYLVSRAHHHALSKQGPADRAHTGRSLRRLGSATRPPTHPLSLPGLAGYDGACCYCRLWCFNCVGCSTSANLSLSLVVVVVAPHLPRASDCPCAQRWVQPAKQAVHGTASQAGGTRYSQPSRRYTVQPAKQAVHGTASQAGGTAEQILRLWQLSRWPS